MPTHHGSLQRIISARGLVSFQLEIWHDELAKHRVVRGNDPNFVTRMAAVQSEEWDKQYQRRQEMATRSHQAKLAQVTREEKKLYQEEQKSIALVRTQEATLVLESIAQTLQQTLNHNDAVNWEALKDRSAFPIPAPQPQPAPQKPVAPPRPKPTAIPPEPRSSDARFQPVFGLMDKMIATRREEKQAEAGRRFVQAHAEWQRLKEAALQVDARNLKLHTEGVQATETQYGKVLAARSAAHLQERAVWDQKRQTFLSKQQEQNAAIDAQKSTYLSGSPGAVLGYCDMVLSQSRYPDFCPKEYEMDFNPETKSLIVDYSLPPLEAVPTVIEVRYVVSSDEFTEKSMTALQAEKQYDSLLYQIALRTVHEIFESDVIKAIETVTFNGYVQSTDKATGKQVRPCVLSLQTRRSEFLSLNLALIDPKACFKQLKGVGSPKLHSVAPVAPILRIRRDDGRFVSAYDVTDRLDEGYNLATMDWEDFEHLVREVFGKEFSSNGGEVKVTQASRDGGVDAVAFDPDPIRGGKIVIQAKRYSNTVGVAAVRDLYGTVMNEGATKGILVTTSDYGPDAHEFAKGKPLTLLNGGNLLHLLEKHGHQARINLNEAREVARSQRTRY